MFNFLKKTQRIFAPISGKTVELAKVPDPVFYDKVAGDGIAIESTGDVVVAPCRGTITLLFDSKHAFAVTTDDGIEVLVHIGLDTVMLGGKGFTALKVSGDKVEVGTPVIKIDRELILSAGLSLLTPVLIMNHANLSKLSQLFNKTVSAGDDVIIEYKL